MYMIEEFDGRPRKVNDPKNQDIRRNWAEKLKRAFRRPHKARKSTYIPRHPKSINKVIILDIKKNMTRVRKRKSDITKNLLKKKMWTNTEDQNSIL